MNHFLTIFSLWALLSSACAQPVPSGKRGKEKRHGPPKPGEFLKAFDLDHDGKVSKVEFDTGERTSRLAPEARGKLFARLDKDQDGFITPKELASPDRDHSMSKADLNKDGRISKEEFSKHPPFEKIPVERRDKMFKRFDHNSDGFIDRKDGRHGAGRMGPRGEKYPRLRLNDLDLDKSGALSWEEFRKSPSLQNLSKEERRKAFQKFDANKDDELSSKELRSPFERGPGKGPRKRLLKNNLKPKSSVGDVTGIFVVQLEAGSNEGGEGNLVR